MILRIQIPEQSFGSENIKLAAFTLEANVSCCVKEGTNKNWYLELPQHVQLPVIDEDIDYAVYIVSASIKQTKEKISFLTVALDFVGNINYIDLKISEVASINNFDNLIQL